MFSCRSIARLAASLVAFLCLLTITATVQGEMVYVTSLTNGTLHRFDSADPVNTIVQAANVGSGPTGLAFGPDGNLYIAASAAYGGTPSIRRYNVATQTLEPTELYVFADTFRPTSLVFKGNDLLVGSNPLGAYTGPIVQFANIVGGSPVRSDYTSGGSLATSPGLALSGDGSLYVADQTYSNPVASGPVKRFDAAGTYIDELITDGQSGGPPAWLLSGPTGLAISGNTLYTSSVMNGMILATDLTTDTTELFADTMLTFAVGPLALLSNGQLLSGDPSGFYNSIFHFDTDGSAIGTYALGLGQVGGIAIAPVPEPGTIAFVGIGLVGGAVMLRRRRRATMSA